ncbi:hypothetical protein [Bradyrhizobium cenepequi]
MPQPVTDMVKAGARFGSGPNSNVNDPARPGFLSPDGAVTQPLTGFLRGKVIETCCVVLITIWGLPSDAWLLSVSKTRKNFSASIAYTSLTFASPDFNESN